MSASEAGLAGSLELVERWVEHEGTRVGAQTVLIHRRTMMSFARRLGGRSLADATAGDYDAWVAEASIRQKARRAWAVRSFYRWAITEGIVAVDADPTPRRPPRRQVRDFEPSHDQVAAWQADMERQQAERRARAVARGKKPKNQMTTRRAAAAYLADKRDTGAHSRHTHQEFGYILGTFVDQCPEDPTKITRRDVLRWLKTTGHLSANSRRQYYNRCNAFTAWLVERGVIHKNPFRDVPRPKVPRPLHRSLASTQVTDLLAACISPREQLIVVLGLQLGLRRAKIAGLEVGDLDLVDRTVLVRCAKGGHQRVMPLTVEAVQVLRRYLNDEKMSRGPLLRSLSDPQAGISPTTVGMAFTRLAYRAGVKTRAGDGVGTHSQRHTFAPAVYEGTADVLAVRDLLGHESLGTTQRYVRGMNTERLRAAVEGRTYLPGPAASVQNPGHDGEVAAQQDAVARQERELPR